LLLLRIEAVADVVIDVVTVIRVVVAVRVGAT
jgi:hypothetical protein